MLGHAMDRGGLKDSENAINIENDIKMTSPKINRTLFWRLGTDMLESCVQ